MDKNNVKARYRLLDGVSGILTANLVIIAPVGGWMYLNQNIDFIYLYFILMTPSYLRRYYD